MKLPDLSPSLRALNPHLAGDPTPPRGARRPSALEAQRLAACPPSERAQLAADLDARAKHAAQGAAAQASGADLEAWLSAQHDAARAQGLADVEHLHPETKTLRRIDAHRFEGVRVAKSGPDYRGVLRGGRAVAIEAKNAGRDRLGLVEPPEGDPRRERFDGLKGHQRDALDRAHVLGGCALLVVRFKRRAQGRDVETTYVVPWTRVRELASIGPDEVTGCEAPASGLYLKPYVEGV